MTEASHSPIAGCEFPGHVELSLTVTRGDGFGVWVLSSRTVALGAEVNIGKLSLTSMMVT